MKRIKQISILVILVVLISSFIKMHDFHTSTTKVELNEGSANMTFTSKFVTEDLEKALGVKVNNESGFNSSVQAYLKNNFKVKINGVSKSYNYVSTQTSPKATRLYFEIANPGNVKSIEITNSMLINEFPEQQNFITFSINDARDSFVTKKGFLTGKMVIK